MSKPQPKAATVASEASPSYDSHQSEQGHSYHQGYGAVPTSDPSAPAATSSFRPHHQDLPPHYDAVEAPYVGDLPVKDADLRIRMAFVRKVYSILAAQLGLTTM
jgi:hypothetical protein